jgi:5-oxoprolinase (ATP-hydrolysing) subunit C
VLEVVHPGPLLTIQDRGRPGLAHLGVPPSGACDPWGFAVAGILAGAGPDAAALEVTLAGAELLVVETCAVALAGADLGAERDDGLPLASDAVHRLPAGARVRFGGVARYPWSGGASGMRGYLSLAGGVAAGRVLGSASTLVAGALGGIDGRALRAGDRLVPVRPGDLAGVGRTWPGGLFPHPASRPGPIGLVPGPDLRRLPADAVTAFAAAAWTVDAASDRMGVRLAGTPLAPGAEILSHPLVPGAIQVPAGGRPIVVLADGPTLGGYPVIGVVPRSELPRLGQLRPGDRVTFRPMTADEARAAWREAAQLLAHVAATVGADAVWHRLADDAGG